MSVLAEAVGRAVAPVATRKPVEVTAPHGAKRRDEYYWLRDDTRRDPEVLAHVRAENAYADTVLAPLASFRDTLYGELIGRIKQDDRSVPYRYRGYWYYTRFEQGRDYPVHARRKGDMGADELVMIDVNTLSQGYDYYDIADFDVSPDQRLLAYLEDTVGRRQYTLRIRDLDSGEFHALTIPGLSTSLAWAADSAAIFYVENDPETLATRRVKLHRLGTDPADDATVYEEPDDAFHLSVRQSRSEQYICIDSSSTVSSETRCTPAADPGEFRVLARRRRDFEYDADHLGSRWVIRTNWNAENFRLMVADEGVWDDRDAWNELIAHDGTVLIEGFELFDDFLAIEERSRGLSRLRIVEQGAARYVETDEPAYTMELSVNAEHASDWLRYEYTSLTTPDRVYELNVRTGERRLLKERPVLGGFERQNYVTERLWAPARDGVEIPVSLVYRKGFVADGTAALLQYGYGSYGLSMDPEFSANTLSLLDRGVVYAIAHVRGGQEMGRHWYESGKLEAKRNTFHDFIDVTDFLVARGYAARDRVAAMGGSAGGLLMGAIANLAPEKYRVILSLVPFVDVVTTMLDPSIPLTTNEYDEWGNPERSSDYETMLSYSPYDCIVATEYPAMYVYTGLWDSQVQYWEPVKYVARLRAVKTDRNPLLLRVEMEAGHGGKSGRFRRYRETAEQYAFVLDQLGLAG